MTLTREVRKILKREKKNKSKGNGKKRQKYNRC